MRRSAQEVTPCACKPEVVKYGEWRPPKKYSKLPLQRPARNACNAGKIGQRESPFWCGLYCAERADDCPRQYASSTREVWFERHPFDPLSHNPIFAESGVLRTAMT